MREATGNWGPGRSIADVLTLQRLIGNQAVGRLLRSQDRLASPPASEDDAAAHFVRRIQAPGTVRREIDRQRLNIVGEDHSWSDPRRAQEKAMLDDKYRIPPDHYWREFEFEHDNQPGDDVTKRILYIVSSLLTDMQTEYATLEETMEQMLKREKWGWRQDWNGFVGPKLLDPVSKRRKALVEEGARPEAASVFEAQPSLLADMEKLVEEIERLQEKVERSLDGPTINVKESAEELALVLSTSALVFIHSHAERAGLSLEIVQLPAQALEAKVSESRSETMRDVATRAATDGRTGVWKVGDNHRDDIRKSGGGPFLLTAVGDFQNEVEPGAP